jgi:hypothetical protein
MSETDVSPNLHHYYKSDCRKRGPGYLRAGVWGCPPISKVPQELGDLGG